MTLIEAAKLALEALEEAHPKPYNESVISHVEAITALRTAIEAADKQEPDGIGWLRKDGGYFAQPPAQHEPVAYAVYHRMGGSKTLHWPEQHAEDGDANEYKLVPLYTTPPAAQQEPVVCKHKFVMDDEAPSHACCQLCGEVRTASTPPTPPTPPAAQKPRTA